MNITPSNHNSVPRWLAVSSYFLAALFLLYEMALGVSPSIMTQHLMRDLQIDAAGLGLMAAAYAYAYTLMQIPAGLLFDRFPTRHLITTTLLICALGALCFGSTHGVMLASLGRFLMGFGSAFAFIGVLVVADRFFPPARFALLVGIAQLLAAVGAMSGEAPLALMVNHIGWRPSTQVLAAIGFALTVLVWLIIRDRPIVKPADKATALSPLQSIIEVLKLGQTWWIGLYAFLNWAPVTIFASLWGIPYLVARFQISNTKAASMTAMIWVGLTMASPVLGWASARWQNRRGLLVFSAIIGTASAALLLWMPLLTVWQATALLWVFGCACAGQILTFAMVRDLNKPNVTGTAIGLNNMAVVAGGAVFQPMVGFLLHVSWSGQMSHGIPHYSAQNYTHAMAVIPICFAVSWLVSQFFIYSD